MAKVIPKFRIENNVLIGEDLPIPEKCASIGERILEKLKSRPDFVCQIEAATGRQSTFEELREQSVRCAIWLKRQGIQRGDNIGICTDNNLYTRVPLFATTFIGGVICAWDHDLSVRSARSFISLVTPKVVFANAAIAENIAGAAKYENQDITVIAIGESHGFQSLTDIIDSVDRCEINDFRCTPAKSPRDIASIAWSSGTSGIPKGTELSQLSIINITSPEENVPPEEMVSMWQATIRWNYSLGLFIKTILTCTLAILIPDEDDDLRMIGFIQKYGVTRISIDPCVPIQWVKLGYLEKHHLPSLKKIVVGGAPVKAHQQEALAKALPHCQIIIAYGTTDIGGVCISQTKTSKPGSSGFVCRGVQLKIVDLKTGATLGANKTGEMYLKSSTIMNGYHKNPEATKKAITPDGWLLTGDVAYYDEDGEVFIVGRISDFINYRAINLCPGEIESVLESHPSVLKAVVVPLPHETEEEHPMAFILKVPGKEVTEEELTKLVEKNLPWYCHVRGGFKFMDEFPRTSTGKIAKYQLKEMAKSFAKSEGTS